MKKKTSGVKMGLTQKEVLTALSNAPCSYKKGPLPLLSAPDVLSLFEVLSAQASSNKKQAEDLFADDDKKLIGLKKGPSHLDVGFVWTPYVPLQVTPESALAEDVPSPGYVQLASFQASSPLVVAPADKAGPEKLTSYTGFYVGSDKPSSKPPLDSVAAFELVAQAIRGVREARATYVEAVIAEKLLQTGTTAEEAVAEIKPGATKKKLFDRVNAVKLLVLELGYDLDMALYLVDTAGPKVVLAAGQQVPVVLVPFADEFQTWVDQMLGDKKASTPQTGAEEKAPTPPTGAEKVVALNMPPPAPAPAPPPSVSDVSALDPMADLYMASNMTITQFAEKHPLLGKTIKHLEQELAPAEVLADGLTMVVTPFAEKHPLLGKTTPQEMATKSVDKSAVDDILTILSLIPLA